VNPFIIGVINCVDELSEKIAVKLKNISDPENIIAAAQINSNESKDFQKST